MRIPYRTANWHRHNVCRYYIMDPEGMTRTYYCFEESSEDGLKFGESCITINEEQIGKIKPFENGIYILSGVYRG